MTLFIPCRSSFRRCCGDLPGTRCRRPSPRAFRHLFQLIARVKALFSLSLSLSLSLVPKVSPVESSDSALIGAIMDLFTERGVFSISILIKISIVPRIGNRATEKKERTIPFDLSNVWTTVNLILQIFGKCKGILKVSFFFFFLLLAFVFAGSGLKVPPVPEVPTNTLDAPVAVKRIPTTDTDRTNCQNHEYTYRIASQRHRVDSI